MQPMDLTPEALGVAWGMTAQDCARALDVPAIAPTLFGTARVTHVIAGEARVIELAFGEHGLERISAEMCRTLDVDGGYARDEERQAAAEAGRAFTALTRCCHALFGRPDYAGKPGDRGFPTGIEGPVHWWQQAAGRLVIVWERDGPDDPYSVRLWWERLPGEPQTPKEHPRR